MSLHIENTVTSADSHRHITHEFTVLPGATRLNIDFAYSPKMAEKYGNLLTLSLFDPAQERGTGHRGYPEQHITLSASDSTPGYLPGPLPAGTWTLMVNANLLNPGPPVTYKADISFGFEPVGQF